MSLLEIFHWLEYSPLLVEMRSSPWLFPVIATFHLFGLAVIGGAVLVVDLRLLGFGLTRQSPAQLGDDTLPILLVGLAIMFPTGIFLFMCFATKYYYLTAFWVKLISLIVIVLYSFTLRRRILSAEAMTKSTFWPKLVAVFSLSLWVSIALGGRLIGFP